MIKTLSCNEEGLVAYESRQAAGTARVKQNDSEALPNETAATGDSSERNTDFHSHAHMPPPIAPCPSDSESGPLQPEQVDGTRHGLDMARSSGAGRGMLPSRVPCR
jgi:hypothetical protein